MTSGTQAGYYTAPPAYEPANATMPLIAREHKLSNDSPDHFARVLADQPEVAAKLADLDAATRTGLKAIEGHFNGKPLALLLAAPHGDGWEVVTVVVHPASRARGVGGTLLRDAAALLPGLRWPAALDGLARQAGLAER